MKKKQKILILEEQVKQLQRAIGELQIDRLRHRAALGLAVSVPVPGPLPTNVIAEELQFLLSLHKAIKS